MRRLNQWVTQVMALFELISIHPPLSLVEAGAFARFYEKTHLSVFRYSMTLCGGDQAEAEEITAEAFFRAWDKRDQFSGSASAALGWVITIARNLLIDRRRAVQGRPVELTLEETIRDPGTPIEAALIDQEAFQQALDLVSRLPVPYGDIVTLRYVLGWRVKAIAAHLGMSENAVSVGLRRALAKLQAQAAPREPRAEETA